jgi:hypothetical protein
MPRLVTVQQAAETALQQWLASQMPGVVIWDEWPEASVVFPKAGAISVLRAGPMAQDPVNPPQLVGQTAATGSPPVATYTWRIASCEQPLQLDVWATSKIARDDLIARLEDPLSASKAATLAAYIAANPTEVSTNQDAVAESISLQLAGTWAHIIASYRFDQPETDDSPDSNKRREYRASYRGSATFDRTVDKVSAPIINLRVKASVYDVAPGPLSEIVTASGSSVARRRGA